MLIFLCSDKSQIATFVTLDYREEAFVVEVLVQMLLFETRSAGGEVATFDFVFFAVEVLVMMQHSSGYLFKANGTVDEDAFTLLLYMVEHLPLCHLIRAVFTLDGQIIAMCLMFLQFSATYHFFATFMTAPDQLELAQLFMSINLPVLNNVLATIIFAAHFQTF